MMSDMEVGGENGRGAEEEGGEDYGLARDQQTSGSSPENIQALALAAHPSRQGGVAGIDIKGGQLVDGMKRRGSIQPGPNKENTNPLQNVSPLVTPAGTSAQSNQKHESAIENTRPSIPTIPEKRSVTTIVSGLIDENLLSAVSNRSIRSESERERPRRVSNPDDPYNLIRRGSVMPDGSFETLRRSRIDSLMIDKYRKGSIKRGVIDVDSHYKRREPIDGGALKQLAEYLKSKSYKLSEDVSEMLSTVSLARSSISTVLSALPDVEVNPNDPHSFSRCDLVYVERVEIHWTVNFETEVLEGDVTLEVRRRSVGSTVLSLDTHMLNIRSVGVNGKMTPYVLYPQKQDFGARMDVELPDNKSDNYYVYIKYITEPKSPALQWLKTNFEGKKGFLFTQCDSIQCRSFIPIQDTPSNKVKFTARITAPTGMKVLMSAPREKQFVMHPNGSSTHYFRQDIPVSPYLIAFAVGNLARSRICERTTVWAMPEYIERVKRNLACTEDLLCIAETICGSYAWQKFDVLVLPESEFNLSAMENPSLTFVNPGLVSGDGCIAMYMAHEIAHSWVGNLVTHTNYEHLWISEGFANFIGRKILGKKFGQEYRLFAASRGFKDLQMVVDIYGHEHPLTCLVADLSNRKPREAVLIVPYEKGHTLLYYLEILVQDPYEMDQYVKEYIATFKGQSINSSLFRSHFKEFFSKCHALKDIDWNAWFNSPGMPPFRPDYQTSLEETCSALKEMWLHWKKGETCPFKEEDLNVLSVMQILEFLSQLLECPPQPHFKLQAMDSLYKLEKLENPDARLKWYLLCLRGRWRAKVEPALHFARGDGRQFCVLAVFHELMQWDDMRTEAVSSFYRMKSSLSAATVQMLATLLHLDSDEAGGHGSGAGRRRSTGAGSTTGSVASERRRSSVVAADMAPLLTVRRKSVLSHHPRSQAGKASSSTDKGPP